MDIEIIRRICLARHLFELGTASIKQKNDLYLFSAVNLLQDAVEAFLLAVADAVGASLDVRTAFDKYFVKINEKLSGKELPLKNKLLRLNRIRVDSKHYGIQPSRDECEKLPIIVRAFFEDVSASILNINFSTISVIDLINEGAIKDLLLEAKSCLEKKQFEECAIACRKVIYLELEKYYDISPYRETVATLGWLGAFTKAPLFTRNASYIEKNVRDPTDYIVYDYSDLEQELLKNAIDNTAFWNVWRLTPQVYQNKEGGWVIKHDFDKLEPELLKDKIEYIFSTTVDIIFTIHSKKRDIKSPETRLYYIELNQEEVPVYEKADQNSTVSTKTPPGLTKLDTDFHVMGLKGDGTYWHVLHSERDNRLVINKQFIIGYIHNSFVK